VISSRDPDKIVVARNGSPLLLGIGKDGDTWSAPTRPRWSPTRATSFTSTTATTRWLQRSGYQVYHLELGRVLRGPCTRITWDLGAIEKSGFRALHAQGDLPSAQQPARRDARPVSRKRATRASGGITLKDEDLLKVKRT